MTVSADPAGAPSAFAVLTVDDIYNNIGDSLELSGFPTPKLNGVFKIIDIPDANTVVVENDLILRVVLIKLEMMIENQLLLMLVKV